MYEEDDGLQQSCHRQQKAMANHCCNSAKTTMESSQMNNGNGASGHQTGGVVFGRGSSVATQIVSQRNPLKKQITFVGTWNVRSFNIEGKLENTIKEMKKMGLSVLGVSETHWIGEDDFDVDNYRVIGAGGEERSNGVAIIVDKKMVGEILHIDRINERVIMVKIKSMPIDTIIIQVYMPTSATKDDEIEGMYETIQDILDNNKGNSNIIIMGDFNAVVGEGKANRAIGNYGLGKRNKRGQRLIDFAKQNQYVICNTTFCHHKRRRYTWKKPGDTGRFQLDYVLVKKRYRNSVSDCHAYPGPDIFSDHNPVVMNFCVKFKKLRKKKTYKRWDTSNLKTEKGQKYVQQVEESINHDQVLNVDEEWLHIKDVITKSATENLGLRKTNKAKKPWITPEMIKKIDERRQWKNSPTDFGKRMYRKLNNELRRETDKARDK